MTKTSPQPGLIQRLYVRQPAVLLLAGSDAQVAGHDGQYIGRAWLWLGVTGLAWGIMLALLWNAGMSVFGRQWASDMPLLPVAIVLLAMGLGPFRQTLSALSAALDGRTVASQATLAGTLLAVLALCLLDLPCRRPDYATWLPQWLQFVWPVPENRVLVLMPIWGVWAMMAPVHFCRPAEGAAPLVAAFSRQQPVAATALWMAIPLAATLWWLKFLQAWVALPAGMGLLVGCFGGILLCRRHGGVCRHALLAANMATQGAYLLGYLAGKALLINGH